MAACKHTGCPVASCSCATRAFSSNVQKLMHHDVCVSGDRLPDQGQSGNVLVPRVHAAVYWCRAAIAQCQLTLHLQVRAQCAVACKDEGNPSHWD